MSVSRYSHLLGSITFMATTGKCSQTHVETHTLTRVGNTETYFAFNGNKEMSFGKTNNLNYCKINICV